MNSLARAVHELTCGRKTFESVIDTLGAEDRRALEAMRRRLEVSGDELAETLDAAGPQQDWI